MSVKYLYFSQKNSDPYSITVYNTSGLVPSITNVKFMIMHYSSDPFGIIQGFLTSNGYIFTPNRINTKDHNIVEANHYTTHTKHFPVNELFLALGPLQTEVIIRMNARISENTNGTAIQNLTNNIAEIRCSMGNLLERISVIERNLSVLENENKELSGKSDNMQLRIVGLEEKTYINANYFGEDLQEKDEEKDKDIPETNEDNKMNEDKTDEKVENEDNDENNTVKADQSKSTWTSFFWTN